MDIDKLEGNHHFRSADDVKVVDSNGTKYAIGYDRYDYLSIEKGDVSENENGEMVFYSEETTGVNLSKSAVEALKEFL